MAFAFDPGSAFLFAVVPRGKAESAVMIWDLSNEGRSPTLVLEKKFSAQLARLLAFRRDSQFATCAPDGTLTLWALEADRANVGLSGKVIARVSSEGADSVAQAEPTAMEFSAAGDELALGDSSGNVKTWRLDSGGDPRSFNMFKAHASRITAFKYDGTGRLVSAGADGTIKVWRSAARTETIQHEISLRGHDNGVDNLAYEAAQNTLLSIGEDRTIRRWSLSKHAGVSSPILLRDGTNSRIEANGLAFRPDSGELAASSASGLDIWSLSGSEPKLRHIPLQNSVRAVAYNGSGSALALAARGRPAVAVWDTKAHTNSPLPVPEYANSLCSITFRSDTVLLAAGARLALRWDLAASHSTAYQEVWRAPASEHPGLQPVLSEHDLLLARFDRLVEVWDLRLPLPSKPLYTLERPSGGPGEILGLGLGGRWLAVPGSEQHAFLWNLETAASRANPIELRGPSFATAGAFGPNNAYLYSGGIDHITRIWNLLAADPSLAPVTLQEHGESVRAVRVSDDGKWLASMDNVGAIRLWHMDVDALAELAHDIAGRDFTPDEVRQYFSTLPPSLHPQSKPR